MEDDKQEKSSTTTQSSSKLECLSREDLIKLVKKQLLIQKDTNKQLEFAKKEVQDNASLIKELSEKLNNQQKGGELIVNFDIQGESMLAIELADYKKAIGLVRKELQENKDALSQKETLIQELSQRIEKIQEEKEEINCELKTQLNHSNELRKQIEEKSIIITEKSQMISKNSKEINSLLVQLYESRQAMQDEIRTLQKEIHTQAQQLIIGQRADKTKNTELRRLRSENETLTLRIMNLEEEFANYKQQADYALKTKINLQELAEPKLVDEGCERSSNINGIKSNTNEIGQLLELLRQRNVEISELSVKCSLLEEEVRGSQDHARTLLNEIDALHNSIADFRRQHKADRQRLNQEWEQRIKEELALKCELEQELRISKEREESAVKLATQTELRLTLDCQRICKELEETKDKLSIISQEEKSTKNLLNNRPIEMFSRQQIKNNKLTGLHRPHKLHLFPVEHMNLDARDGEEEHEQENGLNSESSDSLDNLQSVLQQAEHAPTCDVPSLNVATVLSAPKDDLLNSFISAGNDGQHQLLTISEQLRKQLIDCRDLLNEAEETNVHYVEQINVLKEEIRRLERAQKRVEHLGNGICSEYFKNIVLKFLAPQRVQDERTQLLPVLQTILNLDERELEEVRLYCAMTNAAVTTTIGENNQTTSSVNTTEPGGGLTDWSSWIAWK